MESRAIYLETQDATKVNEETRFDIKLGMNAFAPIAYGIFALLACIALYWAFGMYFLIGLAAISIVAVVYVLSIYNEIKGINNKELSYKDIIQELEQECK